ncbi:MAG: 5-aminolevulic acid synthase [Gemmobacter sp.]
MAGLRIAMAAALVALAGPAPAQVSGADAGVALFPPGKAAIVFTDAVRLNRNDRRTLEQVVVAVKYYGAIAFAPDRGLMSEATAAAQNYHSVAAAEAAALADCAAKSGGAACVVVAQVVPEGFAARPLQMSAAATEAFGADYLPASAPKAFALSTATGSWGFARGQGAAAKAIADCRTRSATKAAADCAVVVAD